MERGNILYLLAWHWMDKVRRGTALPLITIPVGLAEKTAAQQERNMDDAPAKSRTYVHDGSRLHMPHGEGSHADRDATARPR